MPFLAHLHSVAARKSLAADQAENAMSLILSGEATTAQIAAFLVALRMKGETSDELVGFARAMRAHAAPVSPGLLDVPLVDTCGTGGDGLGTFNISTVVAIVAAGAGVAVAKHGNRSISSMCGSADVLEALGVNIALTPDRMAASIREVGIGFLFAPALHPAMKHAQPARVELKMRTAFNLLGPLTNPAGAKIQLIGAPSVGVAQLMANALARLPVERALIVHGSDGLDEITTTGLTTAFEVHGRKVSERTFLPAEFGLPTARVEDLQGGDKGANAAIARSILAGDTGPGRDIVVANAAAVLWLAGKTDSMQDAAQLAAASIDSGAARAKLDHLVRFSNS
jgi:anthranilate phosphoribosyltransferase